MSNKEKRERAKERLRKRVEDATELVGKKTKKETRYDEDNNKKECDHVWIESYESRDHTEITYSCENCFDRKTEKQTFEPYKFKLLPHELKNHGPAEHHLDTRKYAAPSDAIKIKGNLILRNKIFDNCFKNRVITNVNVTGLEEKSDILDTIIPKIIVDECVASKTLLEKIQEQGYNVWYLGKGLPDEEIFKIVEEQKAILVTEDEEFHNKVLDDKLTHDPIFVIRNIENVMDNVGVIQRHMKRFEEKRR
jgi:predicted nuclease of predicted toxin-antitoxin system